MKPRVSQRLNAAGRGPRAPTSIRMLKQPCLVQIDDLAACTDLRSASTRESVVAQLDALGWRRPAHLRFAVEIDIVEGDLRPAKDVDNYAKPMIDAVTESRRVWFDDEQIDELQVRRRREARRRCSSVELRIRPVEGQHGSVPTFFRACCVEARGAPEGYAKPGSHLALHLLREQPDDCSDGEWEREVQVFLDAVVEDEARAWQWFCEKLPAFKALVPVRRRSQFFDGIRQMIDDDRVW